MIEANDIKTQVGENMMDSFIIVSRMLEAMASFNLMLSLRDPEKSGAPSDHLDIAKNCAQRLFAKLSQMDGAWGLIVQAANPALQKPSKKTTLRRKSSVKSKRRKT